MAGTILSVGDRARRGVRRGGTVTFSDIIGRSQSMERVIRLARKAAASTIPILT